MKMGQPPFLPLGTQNRSVSTEQKIEILWKIDKSPKPLPNNYVDVLNHKQKVEKSDMSIQKIDMHVF